MYVGHDTWSIARHPDVLAAVTRWPRLKPVWAPAYAAWLNPIAKVWRWLRQDQADVQRLADAWTTLRQRVNAWLEQFARGSHA